MASLTVESVRAQVETALSALLSAREGSDAEIYEIMRYSALGGGKRVRAFLTYAFFGACGGTEFEKVTDYACAVEMIHAASLVHDDLPALDNDDMRRGRPSCHKAYGEAQAIVAADGLFIKAFEVASANRFCTPAQNAAAVNLLARMSGPDGMCGGQMTDIRTDGGRNDIELLKKLDIQKTSCLINAACGLGCIAAGADESQLADAEEYARELGLAFQIRDDILDIEGDPGVLGKTVGKDAASEKPTYPSVLGLDGAKRTCIALSHNAARAAGKFGENEYAVALRALALGMAERRS
ncbi:MAG: polyprenyl synthetase family protein [Clostridia bacterium]|nr:polyprenyl synthetase family protein [Clostridia bacterium]